MIPAYPLQWPAGWKRTPPAARERARFRRESKRWVSSSNNDRGGYYATDKNALTINDGTVRVREQLQRMGVRDDDLVISSNLELRLDGFPKSGQREPGDPGIAVYWRDGAETRCMAIDCYDRVADNLAAVAATLEAMRAIERHGGAEILSRAFIGFAALPPPTSARPWWRVLELDETARGARITASYRLLRSQTHPDKPGGDADRFRAVQAAYDEACQLGYA